MDIDVHSVLRQLDEVSKALKCGICSKKCVEPIRLKVCGHYFCLNCFKVKEAHICPNCELYYEEREVDYHNIALQTLQPLEDLKTYLLDESFPIDINNFSITDQDKSHIFVYNHKTYHINYLEETCSKVNAKGETALHIACKKKNMDNVKQLIARKMDLNVKDFAGWAPLHEAIETGNMETVEILLKHGALINIPGPEYETPLHKAAMLEHEQLVKMLLKYGANKDLINYFGRKPEECTQNEQIKRILSENFACVNRIEELFCKKKITVYLNHTEDSYKDKLLTSKLAKIENDFDPKRITHFIIRRTHKLSIKILLAMLEGCSIVPQEWIDDFLSDKYFIPVPQYTFISNISLNNGIRQASLNILLKQPKLFDGINFFIHGHNCIVETHNIKLTKESIASIICAGGGKLLHRAPTPTTCEEVMNYPYHTNKSAEIIRCCHYIIYEEKKPPMLRYQMAEIKHKSSSWLIECVINFTIND